MSDDVYSWTCPYCRQVATIKSDNESVGIHFFNENNKHGFLGLRTFVTVCPNDKCREYTIFGELFKAQYTGTGPKIIGEAIIRWRLKPQSAAKPFPDYIPVSIRNDYEEACLISAPSPKASATLSRRCLQGIIRDFWGIRKSRLVDEIKELEGLVDSTTWAAIDSVRSLGNIGAHMEKDIDLIIDVDPEEAGLLIHLIEVLLEEWYIRRYEREQHMQKVIAAAGAKEAVRDGKGHKNS